MSGRGKGDKGLGRYRANIDPKGSKVLFLRVLPKKYHKAVQDKKFPDATIEHWLHTILEGQEWERRNLRQEITQQLGSDKTIRFVKVEEITPVYAQMKKDYNTKTITKLRKRKMLQQLVQIPQVKYAVGSPAYIQAMQQFQKSAKRLHG